MLNWTIVYPVFNSDWNITLVTLVVGSGLSLPQKWMKWPQQNFHFDWNVFITTEVVRWWPVHCPPAEADYNRDWQKAIFRASGAGCGWMVVGRVYLGCISASWEPPLLGCRRRSELPTRVILSSCQCQCRLSPHSSQIFPPSPQQF